MPDLEKTGVELVAGGLEAFKSGMSSAGGALETFGTIATNVGGAALDTLGSGIDQVAGLITGAFKVAAGIGVAAIGAFAAGVANGAFEAEGGARTIDGITRVLTGMGDQTDITTSQVTDLAAKFQILAGGSDDAVLAIEDLAIKSGAISSKQLPDFIQQSLDLGAVMGDNATAAQALARAYEQPSSIIPKLRKEGILFTDAEEAQIKALEKAGDKAGALAIVQNKLAEVTGGAALRNTKDLTGAIEIVKNVFGEAFETIGSAFLPVMQELGGVLIDQVVPAINTLAGGLGEAFSALLSGQEDVQGAADIFAEFANDVLPGSAEAIRGFGEAAQSVVDFVVANLPAMQATAMEVFGSIQEIAGSFGAFFTDVLAPAVGELFTKLSGGEATSAQDVFTGVLNTIKEGAAGLAAFVNDPLIPALTVLVNWLGANLPGAIQTLVAFWNDPLQPALQDLWAFINDPLIPIMGDIAVWLGENVPVAMQALADFWNSTLHPALIALWAYINDPVIPIVKDIANWLGVNVPIAMQALVDFWNSTLKPALTALWAFILDPLLPIFVKLTDLIGSALILAINALVTVWDVALKPMLDALWTFIKDNVSPTVTALKEAFKSLGDSIDWLTGMVQTLADALHGLKIPDALTPGSPTPFEIGLRGISSALTEVTGKMKTLDSVNRALVPVGSAVSDVASGTAGARVAMTPVIAQGGTGPTYNNDIRVQAVYNGRKEPGNIWHEINHGLGAALA